MIHGTFIGRIRTVKPLKEAYDGAGAIVEIKEVGGEPWSIWAQYEPEYDLSGEEIGSETTCEAIKDGDFDHPGPCKARFDEEGVTIRFSASLFPEDDEFDVQFTTEKSHETDVVPSDRDDDSVWVEFDLEG